MQNSESENSDAEDGPRIENPSLNNSADTDHDYHLVGAVSPLQPVQPIQNDTDHDYHRQNIVPHSNNSHNNEFLIIWPREENEANSNNNIADPPVSANAVIDNNNDDATGSAPTNSIDLTRTPSPPKKRKRRDQNATPKIGDTDKTKSLDDSTNSVADEDDGLMCPICFESWELSGEHRLCSLKCGHLFGDSCVRRWLAESARQNGVKSCPQCKLKATYKDIRYLFARRLRALDRSEEHRLRDELDNERRATADLRLQLTTANTSVALFKGKLEALEADYNRFKDLVRNGVGVSGGDGVIGNPASNLFGFNVDNMVNLNLKNYKLYMERNIEISREAGCRVMTFAERQSSLIISQKSSQNLFPGYGVRFIDTPTFRPTSYLYTSGQMVRDICLDANQNLLAVASMEYRAKTFDIRTRVVASVFEPSDRALWACAMDRNERENFLYLGAQDGATYLYDIRQPSNVVQEFKIEGDFTPVVTIAPVFISKNFPCGGFIVCRLQSVWLYEFSAETGSTTSTKLQVEGPFISMHYDSTRETLLLSARHNIRKSNARLILGVLEKINNMPIFNIKITFFTSKTSIILSRSTQIAVEANTLIASYVQDTKLLSLFDARRDKCLQSMPVQEPIYDTCPVYTSDATYLAALTESKCRIYKLAAT